MLPSKAMQRTTLRSWAMLLTACAFQLTTAYPGSWYSPDRRLRNSLTPTQIGCADHPSFVAVSPHGTSQLDSSITFTFANAAERAITNLLCPGAAHLITVSFPAESRRLGLLTSEPSVIFTSPHPPLPQCTGLIDLGGSNRSRMASSHEGTFLVPCSAAGGSFTFKVTSVGADTRKGWRFNSQQMTVASDANPGTCADALAACAAGSAEKPGDQEAAAPPPAGAGAGGTQCTQSTLGYDCMVNRGKVTVHWSINTASAPAGNGCTPATLTTISGSEIAANGTLHMAVQGAVPGYVALGFNPQPDEMYPADIILGWAGKGAGSEGFVGTFHVTRSYLDRDANANPREGPSWAYDRGTMYDSATGVSTLCFSRRLRDPRALSSSDLTAVVGTSGAAAGGRRRLTQAQQTGELLGLIWAVHNAANVEVHAYENANGFFLDVNSGVATDAGGPSRAYWIDAHGALMAVAWGLLLPLGSMMPAHRWILGSRKVFGQPLWFLGHLVVQLTGVALFVAGFVIAFTKLEETGELPQGAYNAHENIGFAIMAAAAAQVVFALPRPKPPKQDPGQPPEPKTTIRLVWEMVHHHLGRATILLAWANVYIGIYLYHTSIFAAKYEEWITPIAIVMGLLVITDVVLRLMRPKEKDTADRSAPYTSNVAAVVQMGAPAEGSPVKDVAS